MKGKVDDAGQYLLMPVLASIMNSAYEWSFTYEGYQDREPVRIEIENAPVKMVFYPGNQEKYYQGRHHGSSYE